MIWSLVTSYFLLTPIFRGHLTTWTRKRAFQSSPEFYHLRPKNILSSAGWNRTKLKGTYSKKCRNWTQEISNTAHWANTRGQVAYFKMKKIFFISISLVLSFSLILHVKSSLPPKKVRLVEHIQQELSLALKKAILVCCSVSARCGTQFSVLWLFFPLDFIFAKIAGLPHIAPGGSRHWIKSWHIGWNRLHASRVCTAALNLCCRLWLSCPESDPVSALPVYAEMWPHIASWTSAWVMCHSCSIVAWWNQLGDGEAEVVVFVTDYYTSVDPSFCFLAMPGEHWLKKCSHRKSCKSCSRVSPLRPAQRIKENYPWGKPSNFMLGTPFNFKRERERVHTDVITNVGSTQGSCIRIERFR